MANEGIYGSEVRTETQNPLSQNLGQAKQPNSIALSGVSAPRRADFSQVGEGQRVMAKLLGDSSGLLDKYVENNKQQWELDGRMAYAQGTTEAELAKSGNKYNMAGFLGMKVQTANDQFLQNEYDSIEKDGKTQDPETYRAGLMDKFKAVHGQLGDDPYVGHLLGAAAGESFPKLVAAQTKAHNEYLKDQQYTSYIDQQTSAGTLIDPESPDKGASPDKLRQGMAPESSGLPLDLHKKAITEIIGNTLAAGDPRYTQAFIGSDKSSDGTNIKDLPPQKQLMSQGIDYVLSIEGGYVANDNGRGPTNFGINGQANNLTPDQVKNLTPADARGYYEKNYWNKVITPDMTPDMQLAAFDGAVNQGVPFTQQALKDSGGDMTKFLQLRRDRYIAIAQSDPAQAANLDGWLMRLDKLSTADKAGHPMASTLDGLVTEKKLIMTGVHNGLNEAQINHIQSSWKSYQAEQEQKFDKNKYVDEQTITNNARKDGNLPQQLNSIDQIAQSHGYSDKWKNEMAGKASTQVAEHDKEEKEFTRLDTAGNNGVLGNEGADKQKIAVDRKRAEVAGTWASKPDLNDDQKNQGARQDMTNYLVRNGVVDSTWKKSIAVGLSGDIVDKNGKVSQTAMKAYQDYLYLKQNAPAGYAQNYVEGDAAKLVSTAEAYDINMNSDVALATAAQTLSNNTAGTKPTPPPIDTGRLKALVSDKIDSDLDPGLTSFISRFQAANAHDVKTSDVMQWKVNPVLQQFLANAALSEQMADQSGTLTSEAAINLAWNNNINRIEMAPAGNVLISGKDKSIREELGFPEAHATNLMFNAMQRVGAKYGKAYFGPRYTGTTENAEQQFAVYKTNHPDAGTTGHDERWLLGGKALDAIAGQLIGVPASKMTWDADRKGINWVLTKRDSFGNEVPDGDSVFIPADVIRKSMLEDQVAERSTRSFADYAKNAAQDLKQSVFGKN